MGRGGVIKGSVIPCVKGAGVTRSYSRGVVPPAGARHIPGKRHDPAPLTHGITLPFNNPAPTHDPARSDPATTPSPAPNFLKTVFVFVFVFVCAFAMD